MDLWVTAARAPAALVFDGANTLADLAALAAAVLQRFKGQRALSGFFLCFQGDAGKRCRSEGVGGPDRKVDHGRRNGTWKWKEWNGWNGTKK